MKRFTALLSFILLSSGVLLGSAYHESNPEKPTQEEYVIEDWEFETSGQIFSGVILIDGVIYIGNENGDFYALDLEGNEVWRFKADHAIRSTAVVYGKIVSFTSGNQLYGLNIASGNLEWKHEPTESVQDPIGPQDQWDIKDSSPVLKESVAYYGNEYGHIYGVDMSNGNEVYDFKTTNAATIRSKPVFKGDILFFGDQAGHVFALNVATDKLVWSIETFVGDKLYPEYGGIFGEMVVEGNALYFGSRNGQLKVLNTETGVIDWTAGNVNGTWFSGIPVIKDDVLYIGTSDSHELVAFNTSGKQLWRTPTTESVYNAVIVTDDHVITLTCDSSYPDQFPSIGHIHILKYNGTVDKSIELPGGVYHSPKLVDGALYFASRNSKIYKMDLKNLLQE